MQPALKKRNNLLHGLLLLLLLLLCTGAPFAYASTTVGTIDSTYKYAWGSVAGYVNFAPAHGGLTVTDTGITGYAWAQSTGWINFHPFTSGVTNNGNGTLGGFAWDETDGWVSFTGVTIDSNGKFHGQATGGTVSGAQYVINFDCTKCDVRTDWRPVSYRPSPAATVSNGAPSLIGVTNNPTPPAIALLPPASLPTRVPTTTIAKLTYPVFVAGSGAQAHGGIRPVSRPVSVPPKTQVAATGYVAISTAAPTTTAFVAATRTAPTVRPPSSRSTGGTRPQTASATFISIIQSAVVSLSATLLSVFSFFTSHVF